MSEVELLSDVGADYTQLRDLLAAGKWKEADEETGRAILKVARWEKEGYLDMLYLRNCEALPKNK